MLLFLDERFEIPTRETLVDRDNDRRLDYGTLCSFPAVIRGDKGTNRERTEMPIAQSV